MNLNDYLSLFPGASREKPKFMALAEAVLSQVTDLMALVAQMQSGFSFATAVGKQLDQIAEGIGLKREDAGTTPTIPDGMFRNYIMAKLALWRWNGTNAGVPSVFDGSMFAGSTQRDNTDGTVTAVPVPSPPAPPVTYAIGNVFPYPAGVRFEEGSE